MDLTIQDYDTWRSTIQLHSHSEQDQDLMVLYLTGSKTQGCFVEFGAMDGIRASNTWLLEQHFDWQGLLVEPMPKYQEILPQNRTCRIDHRCVSDKTGKTVDFSTADQGGYPGMIGYNLYGAVGTVISVETISLNDLLDQHDMPIHIDYVSMDVDGAEVMILKGFDFDRARIGIWSIEHNGRDFRADVFDLMGAKGYQRVLYRDQCYDDFYIHKDYLDQRSWT